MNPLGYLMHCRWLGSPALVLLLFVQTIGPAIARAENTHDVAAPTGLERFARVDARLLRGSQPDEAQFARLRDLGVRTVVNLRNDDSERGIVERLGMRYVGIPVTMHAFGRSGPLSREAVARFFRVVDDPDSGIVFVHCRRGADRTGTFVALYRIARQHWSSDDAYDEARDIGMRWWHYPVKDQLPGLGSAFAPDRGPQGDVDGGAQ
jgi:protein tyrosine phosphatase (PTP) superfamily phosphohydrolase (DUF442 family)